MHNAGVSRASLTSVILGFLIVLSSCSRTTKSYDEWRVAGGTAENSRYSTLTQIDTSNVKALSVAWTYRTGDADTVNHSQIQCNPIVVDGVLYGTSPQLKVIALDAATGTQKWVFDPRKDSTGAFIPSAGMNNNRGVTFWQDKDDRRIFFAAGPSLYALDANTGKPILQFGNGGKLDLHDGLGRDVKDLYIVANSPGIIYHDLIIMGSRVSEGSDAAPGHIRAYDVRTGAQRWIFHTIPQPGEPGFESWEDSTAYKHIGGANAWAGFSLDVKRGLLFVPTGSASFDFYGGKRKGDNLFANSILALNALTGKLVWHFQTVHHDVWDKDLPTAPSLVTVMHDGKPVDAIAQPTKFGFVFVLNRETGQSLFPVEERPVNAVSELKGEQLSPTQPYPTLPKPFTRQEFTEADINDLISDSSYQEVKKRFRRYASGGMFTPPAKQGTIYFPGLDGGAEWGGAAFDPQSGLLYVNANEMPWAFAMVDVKPGVPKKENYLEAGQRLYQQKCMSCHGANREGAGNFPKLIGVESKYTATTFRQLIASGRRMMPGIKLTDEEASAMASFVLNITANQSRHFVAPLVAVDSFRQLPYTIDGYKKFLTREGYPAIKPPWGTLNAIDLNTGDIAWKIPLGEHPDFVKQGMITGTENYGGPAVTAGGLVFIAATKDGQIRAFNKRTGALLWEAQLPVPAFATPAVYAVNGRQFVVVPCGGGKLGTRSGDTYVAFALPQ
jgi:quinoprotein glucose dehydrogenase